MTTQHMPTPKFIADLQGCIVGAIETPGDLTDEGLEYVVQDVDLSWPSIVLAVNAHAGLVEALTLYIKLDDANRAGCEIEPSEWAECHQSARAALAQAKEKGGTQ